MIRRYELHSKTGVEDPDIFENERVSCRMSLHRLVPGIETPYVMGSPNVISEYPDCKDFFVSAFGSVRARNRLVWVVCLTLQVEI